jgi:alpha,alpha-trehalase
LLSKMLSTVLLSLLPLASALYQNGSVIAPCDSPLYCQGKILREIELARPFEDSKLYVDLYVQSLRHISGPITD